MQEGTKVMPRSGAKLFFLRLNRNGCRHGTLTLIFRSLSGEYGMAYSKISRYPSKCFLMSLFLTLVTFFESFKNCEATYTPTRCGCLFIGLLGFSHFVDKIRQRRHSCDPVHLNRFQSSNFNCFFDFNFFNCTIGK